GERITERHCSPGDTVTFGKRAFRVEAVVEAPPPPPPPAGETPGPRAGATIVRQLPVKGGTGELAAVLDLGASHEALPAATSGDKLRQKLAMLLEVSTGLSRALDVEPLLE